MNTGGVGEGLPPTARKWVSSVSFLGCIRGLISPSCLPAAPSSFWRRGRILRAIPLMALTGVWHPRVTRPLLANSEGISCPAVLLPVHQAVICPANLDCPLWARPCPGDALVSKKAQPFQT